MKTMFRLAVPVTLLLTAALQACSAPYDPRAATHENFEFALQDFLAHRGQLCLGMFDWPSDLTPSEAAAHSSRAVQYPVFEKLGLVTSTVVAVERSTDNPQGVVKRYALTANGRRYYQVHPYTSRAGVQHARDICVAQITLDKVVHWQLDPRDAEHPTALVSYTYQIDPAPWVRHADAQRVLPMVARVIDGAGGRLQLQQQFTLGDNGWVARSAPV
ncbi:hypothetical protein [Solimonas marina]|uniref:Lipoprotein n=1 Tax=Solimonas marina TaxID=2714601 RepID=A0A969WB47_9GAMM|nr:hypothetical protein [Solimonas marina]NKF22855.1 hypothetical protein [Solimonas marina]